MTSLSLLTSPLRREASRLTIARTEMARERSSRDEEIVREWLSSALAISAQCTEFDAKLDDGQLVCELMNTLQPNIITRIATPSSHRVDVSRCLHNSAQFKDACIKFGITTDDLCPVAMHMANSSSDRASLVRCLTAVRRIAQSRGSSNNSNNTGVINVETSADETTDDAPVCCSLSSLLFPVT
jgi:hypothetical protein